MIVAARVALAGLLLCGAPTVRAQDFVDPAPASRGTSALRLLEQGLPDAHPGASVATAFTRWWGLPELTTRTVAGELAWHSLRLASGLARSGEPALGWSTVAFAIGVVGDDTGVALRGAVRLDRDTPWTLVRASSPASGLECGAGAWLCPAHAVRVWVSAPQLARGGPAPPFVRPLECGVRLGESSAVWCTLRAPHDGDDGMRALGAALELAPVLVWVELRDAPLRAATGLSLAVAGGTIAWRLDDHPVLGETVRLAFAWHGGGGRP